MTSIDLPGATGVCGYADWGRFEPSAMIAMIRRMAAQNKASAEAILAASDEDFRVETYVGVHVKRQREVLQEGRPARKGGVS